MKQDNDAVVAGVGTEGPVNGQAGAVEATAIFPNEEQARAAKPVDHPRWKLWKVTSKAGAAPAFLWARSRAAAIQSVAIADGYDATNMDRQVNKEALAQGLAALSEDERRALLAQYMPSKKAK
jgi:hypothetical protein